MATYVVGDLQGCFSALQQLLARIAFNPEQDTLIFAGDLVSRGEDSLSTLRLLHRLGSAVQAVLGNHDLHLLALAHGVAQPKAKEKDLEAILTAPDGPELLSWLQSFPLVKYLPHHNTVITHAGWHPFWSLKALLAHGEEVTQVLQGPKAGAFFHHMYGNEPAQWQPTLTGMARLRFITNAFTRMRFLTATGALNLTVKGPPHEAPEELIPWFKYPSHHRHHRRVLFGHWAALEGRTDVAQVEALDTGCVWGGCLTALCLETQQRFQVSCA